MASRPYFTITPESFEKNAGYKSTVHALAELIDNSFEANARNVVVVMMVDHSSRLRKIAVADDGDGMGPDLLQEAICEKAGSYLSRQRGTGPDSRRKLGKYGVGLPKASISQCNKFTVWSWTQGQGKGYMNHVNITDAAWINKGALVGDSVKQRPPVEWLQAAELATADHGTLVLWENLDGVTWSRARWGSNAGLIPNLEFDIGRVYRKMISSGDLKVSTVVIDELFKVQEKLTPLSSNDPLYLTPGLRVPRSVIKKQTWPPEDPLFDDVTSSDQTMEIKLPLKDGKSKTVNVSWRASNARRKTFAKYDGREAGSLDHGKHAAKNVGLSVLREGREIQMSMALANPSEPRERWFGVEVDFPHELDDILGMTNNKQEYTRFERVLRQSKQEFMLDGETTDQCLSRIAVEDNILSICLRLAWTTQDVWREARKSHMKMREDKLGPAATPGPDKDGSNGAPAPATPEEEAEAAASGADSAPSEVTDGQDFKQELIEQGVPEQEAEQIAARIIERGLKYAITHKSGIGSPFFNVSNIRNVKFIELNTDHRIHNYLRSTIDDTADDDIDTLRSKLENAKVATLLMLEAWAKIEAEAVDSERRKLHVIREDWGRRLNEFIEHLEDSRRTRGSEVPE